MLLILFVAICCLESRLSGITNGQFVDNWHFTLWIGESQGKKDGK